MAGGFGGGVVTCKPTLFIVSGGVGASAEQVVHTVLAQFANETPGAPLMEVVTLPNLRYPAQLAEAVERARACGGIIVHTLVDSDLRRQVVEMAATAGVPAVDLMGDLIGHISRISGQPPLGQPGLYRRLNRAYYDRVGAMEYAMAHDDGKQPEGWSQADVLLLGVSRSGKTPLSLYLSVLGWKAANQPLVPGLELPTELDLVDPQRIIGLRIDAGQLLLHRQQRQKRLGAPGPSRYTQPEELVSELDYANQVYRRLGCSVLDVTDKPIETSADEVIRLLTPRFNKP
jgi:[pyruvate, water dikinase]-phosphate phosphotransferase / [pyruvate, water dikinase] kinase